MNHDSYANPKTWEFELTPCEFKAILNGLKSTDPELAISLECAMQTGVRQINLLCKVREEAE